jgi:hypothetical protein
MRRIIDVYDAYLIVAVFAPHTHGKEVSKAAKTPKTP